MKGCVFSRRGGIFRFHNPMAGKKKSVSLCVNDRGSVLLPVVIVTSVAVLLVAIAISMIPSHQKEGLFVQQKLSTDILKYGIINFIRNPQYCACMLSGQTLDGMDNDPQNLSLPGIRRGCGGGDAFVSTGDTIGYGVTVDSINIKDIRRSGTDRYAGHLSVSYDTGSLFRSLSEFEISLELVVGPGPPHQRPVTGCVLVVSKILEKDKKNCGYGHAQSGKFHDYGKGFVANTATVAASVWVGPDAKVCDTAQVSGNVRIEDGAVIKDHSRVSDYARVSGTAEVSKGAVIRDRAHISGGAEVSRESIVKGQAQVRDEAKVENSIISETADISGKAKVFNSRVGGRSTVKGKAHVEAGALVGLIRAADGTITIAATNVIVQEYSKVRRGAIISGEAKISGFAEIGRGAHVSGNAAVYDNAKVSAGAQISGNAAVYDWANVSTGAQISGTAKVHGEANVDYGEIITTGDIIE